MMQKLRIRIGSVDTFHGVTNPLYGCGPVDEAVAMEAPPAAGVRVPYDGTPAELRAWVDGVLGSPVVSAVTQTGGFSPGVAARLVCRDGTRAFCKAVTDVNDFAPDAHRRERRITASLPAAVPAPRLLDGYDDGRWVALLLEDVEGRHPRLPWDEADLRRVLDTVDELGTALTPCPVVGVPSVTGEWREDFDRWRSAVSGEPPAGLEKWPWAARHLPRLAELEPAWEAAATGDTLLHMDLRADNLLLDDDRVWVVDWPHAARGAAVFDLVAMAPSVAMQGGPDPATVLSMAAVGRVADPEAVTALVCAVAGYFVVSSLSPPPPGLPTVRAFQAAQGEVALRWLQSLTGWG
jgi:hypothetical protein